MKKSVNYWIRVANGARKVVGESKPRDSFELSKKYYGSLKEGFTTHEWKIINGELIGSARKDVVSKLISKAEDYGRFDVADKVRSMYEYLYNDLDRIDQLPRDESLDILDNLTPENMKEKK